MRKVGKGVRGEDRSLGKGGRRPRGGVEKRRRKAERRGRKGEKGRGIKLTEDIIPGFPLHINIEYHTTI